MNNFAGTWTFLLLMMISSISAYGQTTEFTFQGSLQNSSAPANGNFDLEFLLFDSITAGTQTGPTLTRSGVAVTAGSFAVKLDFGGQFSGSNRYLEIHVRPTGGGAFTPLTPRQLVSSTPYSVQSLNASQLGGQSWANYVLTGDTRLSDARPPTAGSSNYIQNSTSAQTANFNVSGNGAIGGTLSAGTINATAAVSAGSVNSSSEYFIGGISALRMHGSGNTETGNQAGLNNSGSGNSMYGQTAGRQSYGDNNSFFGAGAGYLNGAGIENSFYGYLTGNNSQGNRNSFFGFSAGIFNTTGNSNSLFGYSSKTAGTLDNATAIGANAQVSQSNSLVLGSINGVNGATADSNVGIGTTSPVNRLHVNGTVRVTNGAVYITNPNTVIITSPNGACWGITVGNTGLLSTFPVTPCP